jgi:mono/diheme cytochrome c family protein
MKSILLAILFSLPAFAGLEGDVSVDDLDTYLQKNGTIEKFIANLEPQLRSQYVLMHSSKSLQGADYQKPRVILFNKTGQLLLSFTDETKKNGDKIEVILFNQKKASFEAHEIDFATAVPRLNRNPQKCLACHGADLRPNWNTYSFWEGAYGSNDSRLSRPGKNRTYDPTEYLEIQKFVTTYRTHPRYKHLEKLEDMSRPENGSIPTVESDSDRMKSKNLEALTALTTRLNNRRFRRILEQKPQFSKFKYSILALLSCDLKSFKKSLPEGYPLVLRETFSYDLFAYDPFAIGRVRDAYYLALLESLGIDQGFLDTTFNLEYPIVKFEEPEIVSYSTSRFSTGLNPQHEFAYEWVAKDPDLLPFVEPIDQKSLRAIVKCEELAKKARVELSGIVTPAKKILEQEKGKRVFESTCLRCHTQPEVVEFQFNGSTLRGMLERDPELANKFEERLSPATPVGRRMPLGIILSADEREAVRKYIDGFKSKNIQ